MGLNKGAHGYVRIERVLQQPQQQQPQPPKYKQLITDTSIDGNWTSSYYGEVVISNTRGGNSGFLYWKTWKETHAVTYEGNNKWTIQDWPSSFAHTYIYGTEDATGLAGKLLSDVKIAIGLTSQMFTLI
jgi:hypothetical protein